MQFKVFATLNTYGMIIRRKKVVFMTNQKGFVIAEILIETRPLKE